MKEAGNAEYLPKRYVKDIDPYNRTDRAAAPKAVKTKPIDKKAVQNFIRLANEDEDSDLIKEDSPE